MPSSSASSRKEILLRDERLPKPGQVVRQRYLVESVLGAGGFAAVYRATDKKLGGEVALKVLDPEKSRDPNLVKRFRQEISLVRRLRHHNSIKVWDAGVTETKCLYMATELVVGKDLQQLLRHEGAMAPERVVRIAKQVLRSLAEAHKLGIVHRDLKPANIMVCQPDGEPDYVKVLDFGIAKVVEDPDVDIQTQSGYVMCTPSYAAPEVVRERDLRPASDIYSLGLVMIETLTGDRVVTGDSIVEIMLKQASAEPIELPDRFVGTSLGAIIDRATTKDLTLRYTSAMDMLSDLDALGVESGAATQRTSQFADLPELSGEITSHLSTDPVARGDTPQADEPSPPPPSSPARPAPARRNYVIGGLTLTAMVAVVIAIKMSVGGVELEPAVTPVEPTVESVADVSPQDHDNALGATEPTEPEAGTNRRDVDRPSRQNRQGRQLAQWGNAGPPPADVLTIVAAPRRAGRVGMNWVYLTVEVDRPGVALYHGQRYLADLPFDGIVMSQRELQPLIIRGPGVIQETFAVDMTGGPVTVQRQLTERP